jgi:D-methionine transport system substrate-binding protein
MKLNRRFFLVAVSAFSTSVIFSSCTPSPQNVASTTSEEQSEFSEPLRLSVTPVPAGEILAFVRDNIAPEVGLTIKILEFNDFNQPNLALKEGAVEANYYQHIPFMEDFSKQHDMDLIALNPVHFNPLGAFSNRISSLSELQDGATISIPNDMTNGSRALRLLEDEGLLTLREDTGELATTADIVENPKNLRLLEIEAPSLLRSLDDVEVAIITGNFLVQAGLNTKEDAIALEKAGDEAKFAVRLATLRGNENDPRIQKLNELLHDPRVREFINEKYQGAVVSVF